MDIVQNNIELLQSIFPDCFTEGKINFEKLKSALGDSVTNENERYSFSWAGKNNAIQLLQTKSNRTLFPRLEESVNWDETKNIFVEGENLDVLKLLFKSYYGRIKLIYIDPPYNTGRDFIYADNYKKTVKQYIEETGQVDENKNLVTTNPETSGRYHSDWLSMMYPRLFLARELLKDDGAIFVSIDYHELHNLRLLMNEIFGEESFKNIIIFKRGIKSVQAQFETTDSLTIGHEYILFYAKNPSTRFKLFRVELNEAKIGTWNNHWRGTDRPTMRYELFGIKPESGQWRWGKARSFKAIENYNTMLNELNTPSQEVTQEQIDGWFLENVAKIDGDLDLLRLSKNSKPEHYVPPSETKLGSDLWVDLSPRGSADLTALFGCNPFDNPKPVNLIKRIIGFMTEPSAGDIVLDFFAGSGSTAHAVLELNQEDEGNRQFICVQLDEEINGGVPSGKCAKKQGVNTIADICMERIRRVIHNITEEGGNKRLDLGCKKYTLADSNFKNWSGMKTPDISSFVSQMELYSDSLANRWTLMNVLTEIALKETGFSLNVRVEQVPGVTHQEIQKVIDLEKNQFFFACLDSHIDFENIKILDLESSNLFVCRSTALDDSTAANLSLQCRLKVV
jgi:adenine-specific DNA-methyltransferase